jgi:hypothetical protein
MPDPRWLEILKASGWQTAAISAACGLFLFAGHKEWVPPLDPWMIQLAAFGFLLTGFLSVASLISNTFKFFPVQKWLRHWLNLRRAKRAVLDYIPHMTERERQIIGYLFAKNQKMFSAAIDGGYAATLLSRGIVQIAARTNQHVDQFDVPMEIPDYVWDVLIRHKDQFPYKPRTRNDHEVHPWRVPVI